LKLGLEVGLKFESMKDDLKSETKVLSEFVVVDCVDVELRMRVE
jgi:hypothetical protein